MQLLWDPIVMEGFRKGSAPFSPRSPSAFKLRPWGKNSALRPSLRGLMRFPRSDQGFDSARTLLRSMHQPSSTSQWLRNTGRRIRGLPYGPVHAVGNGRWPALKKEPGRAISLGMSVPEDNYGHSIQQRVYAVTDDFRPHYEERKVPKS